MRRLMHRRSTRHGCLPNDPEVFRDPGRSLRAMALTAFKSAVRCGMQISVTDHWMEHQRHTLRTVTKVQGNGFFFIRKGDAARSWMAFPKPAELRFSRHDGPNRDGREVLDAGSQT